MTRDAAAAALGAAVAVLLVVAALVALSLQAAPVVPVPTFSEPYRPANPPTISAPQPPPAPA